MQSELHTCELHTSYDTGGTEGEREGGNKGEKEGGKEGERDELHSEFCLKNKNKQALHVFKCVIELLFLS